VLGNRVSHAGSSWEATRTSTNERPGDGNDAFMLATKRGKDGKDAPGARDLQRSNGSDVTGHAASEARDA
jgi:hypothetical protein